MKKSGIIKNFTEMDRSQIQMEMVAESMNDDFSRHLSAAIGCLVRETVREVVAEMEKQRMAAKRENPTHEEHSQQQEYMTRKEVLALLKR